MRLVPLVFGVTISVAFVGMVYSLIRLIGAEGFGAAVNAQQNNWKYFAYMLEALILPFAAYVVFLVYYLMVDLLRATLCLFQLKEK